MTWVAMVSRRFLNNDFASWTSPDNQHAVWQGHWLGWQSLVDQWTQGIGWACALLLCVAWHRGGRVLFLTEKAERLGQGLLAMSRDDQITAGDDGCALDASHGKPIKYNGSYRGVVHKGACASVSALWRNTFPPQCPLVAINGDGQHGLGQACQRSRSRAG